MSVWERPDAFDPERGACGPGSGRSRTAVPSTTCVARRPGAVGPSVTPGAPRDRPTSRRSRPRCSRPSASAPPLDGAARRPTPGGAARVLRREDLPSGATEVLGIPEGTAKSRLRLGLHRIADALEAQGGEWMTDPRPHASRRRGAARCVRARRLRARRGRGDRGGAGPSTRSRGARPGRLRDAAAWIGAGEALLASRRGLRGQVLAAAAARAGAPPMPRRPVPGQTDELGDAIAALERRPLRRPTANGLVGPRPRGALAAQESLFAQWPRRPTLPDVDRDRHRARGPTRCSRALRRRRSTTRSRRGGVGRGRARLGGRPPRERTATWRGVDVARDDVLAVRAFESWIHADDMRRAAGSPRPAAAPRHLA